MPPLRVSDVEKIKAILQTFSRLDDIRWQESQKYNLINYCRADLSADEKLLTHWLSYIMDRQMPFERIWNVGGYVVSHLVHTYTREPNSGVREITERYVIRSQASVRIECAVESPNARLRRYGIEGSRVSFASRYMPEDAILIYRTLLVLDKMAKRSFGLYLGRVVAGESDLAQAIPRLANALNQLTYAAGGAVAASEFGDRMERETEAAAAFTLDTTTKERLFGRKRLWCSLRDYLKSPEFNEVFVAALNGIGASNARIWHRSNPTLRTALRVLELPGDVWNNSEIFRRGLFKDYLANERKTWDMPRTVREICEAIAPTTAFTFYPEQLDVSFDFVPRMCEREMCEVCLFGAGISKTCHQKDGYLCPVALYSCGYQHTCRPGACDLKNDAVRGTCRASTAKSA